MKIIKKNIKKHFLYFIKNNIFIENVNYYY